MSTKPGIAPEDWMSVAGFGPNHHPPFQKEKKNKVENSLGPER